MVPAPLETVELTTPSAEPLLSAPEGDISVTDQGGDTTSVLPSTEDNESSSLTIPPEVTMRKVPASNLYAPTATDKSLKLLVAMGNVVFIHVFTEHNTVAGMTKPLGPTEFLHKRLAPGSAVTCLKSYMFVSALYMIYTMYCV